MCFRCSNRRGFTLIEIMIVVCIIGILTALAIPRFMTASTKSKQSEAKLILKQIYVNQRTYLQQSGEYFIPAGDASKDSREAFATIWIEIMNDARYAYRITTTNPRSDFLATAFGNIDDDAVDDVWTMDQDGNLRNETNDVEEDGEEEGV